MTGYAEILFALKPIASAIRGEVDIHKLSKMMGTSLRMLEALLEVGGRYGDVQIGLRCREKRHCMGGKPALIATDLWFNLNETWMSSFYCRKNNKIL